MKYELLAIALALGCGASATPAQTASSANGQTHAIHLVRHPRVGARWSEHDHLLATESQTATETGGAPQTHGSTTDITLDVDIEVLAVDANREVSRLRVGIRTFTLDDGHGPQSPVCPPVVIIERGSPGAITDEQGAPIETGTATALGLLLPRSLPPADMDAHYGTTVPQAIGGSWSIDSATAATGLAAFGMTVDPANVSATTTLLSATNDALTMRTVTRASHVGMSGLPAGSVERRADVEAIQEDVLPIDDTLPPTRDSVHATVDVEVDMTTPNGTAAHVVLAMRQEMSHERTMAAAP